MARRLQTLTSTERHAPFDELDRGLATRGGGLARGAVLAASPARRLLGKRRRTGLCCQHRRRQCRRVGALLLAHAAHVSGRTRRPERVGS